MASIIKTDNIQKVSDDSNIIKKCGSTTTVGSGAGNTITVDGATITIGRCGGTVSLAPGATQSGFGTPSSSVLWCNTAKTSPFTASDKEGYFVNTTSGAVTVTLPASPSAGAVIAIKDYARTFGSNNVTLCRNSSKINAVCENATLDVNGQSVELVYVDGTRGWVDIQNCQSNTGVGGAQFIEATGGTIYTCGDFKVHHFAANGTFQVTNAGNSAGSNTVDYLVVGGGGGTGPSSEGGGGGGFRFSASTYCMPSEAPSYPNRATTGLPVSATAYPVVVGAGGSNTSCGSDSSFSTITSAGGGKGGTAGGSGGGGIGSAPAGNTPPVSPPQGNPGGTATNPSARGGGGGGAPGSCGPVAYRPGIGGTAPSGGRPGSGGDGGGLCTSFKLTSPFLGEAATRTPSPTASPATYYHFSGGGAGTGPQPTGSPASPVGTGGIGGGGDAPANKTASSGTANTGGGAGAPGQSGGSGYVVIRYKFQ